MLEKSEESSLEKTKFSIIIPARNEAHNIVNCLQSIIKSSESYSGEIEIILIDDHSEDATFQLANSIDFQNLKVLKLEDHLQDKINAYKKAALNLGLTMAKHEYIIQLDADVIVPPTYLMAIDEFVIQKKIELITGPVLFKPADGFFQNFQCLDMMGMMAVTQAGIQSKKWFMANGANMIYKKTKDNFQNNDVASGDDVYKIQRLAAINSESIYFLKDNRAIVTTAAEKSLSAFYRQRLRWATKNKMMTDKVMLLMMAIPFFISTFILLSIFLSPFWGIPMLVLFVVLVLVKMSVDYVFLRRVSVFFKQEKAMQYFLVSNLMHTVYIFVIGLLSLFVGQHEWKGRKVR